MEPITEGDAQPAKRPAKQRTRPAAVRVQKETAVERARRTPLGARDKTEWHHRDPRYTYRVVNDDPARPGRVEQFKEAGWAEVRDDRPLGHETVDYRRGVSSVVTRPVGTGITGVLMRKLTKEEQEDQGKTVEAKAKKVEQAIFNEKYKQNRYGSIEMEAGYVIRPPNGG